VFCNNRLNLYCFLRRFSLFLHNKNSFMADSGVSVCTILTAALLFELSPPPQQSCCIPSYLNDSIVCELGREEKRSHVSKHELPTLILAPPLKIYFFAHTPETLYVSSTSLPRSETYMRGD
jgi:hypothetical protein